jgi:hypothetical protein
LIQRHKLRVDCHHVTWNKRHNFLIIYSRYNPSKRCTI